MGFDPCKMEPGMWLKYCGDHYEHIAVCADDLLIASKDTKGIVENLNDMHKFKLKGTVPVSYNLGCDFGRDGAGALHVAPCKHIEKIIDCHFNVFGSKPKLNTMSPLEKGDHSEICTSEHL